MRGSVQFFPTLCHCETALVFEFDYLDPLLISSVAFQFHKDSESQFPDLEKGTLMPTRFTGLMRIR